jgi:hypothetical protein
MKIPQPKLRNWRTQFQIQDQPSYENSCYAALTYFRSGIITKQAVILEETLSVNSSSIDLGNSDSSSYHSMAPDSNTDSMKPADSKDFEHSEGLEAETIGSNDSIIFAPTTNDSTSEDTVKPVTPIDLKSRKAIGHEDQLLDLHESLHQDISAESKETTDERPQTPEAQRQKVSGLKENE